jgi:WD40 repeat protein
MCVCTPAAHEKTINAMHSTGDFLVTGCKDGTIKMWGKGGDIALVSQFDLNTASPKPYNSSVRSVCFMLDKHRSTVLVGTKSCDVYEVNRLTGRMAQLSTAHCSDELWGLAPHPSNPDLFLTAGDDKTVRLWSVSRKRQLAMVALVRR